MFSIPTICIRSGTRDGSFGESLKYLAEVGVIPEIHDGKDFDGHFGYSFEEAPMHRCWEADSLLWSMGSQDTGGDRQVFSVLQPEDGWGRGFMALQHGEPAGSPASSKSWSRK